MVIKEESSLIFFVNGKKVIENEVNPEWTLLHYLRKKLLLCGTKLGCAEGGCGACTVMVSKYNRKLQKVVHLAINACLAPVCAMHGLAVTTVEGIGSTKTKLHPVQERIAKSHGSQCGFCTPGIVMSMYTLLRNLPKPSMKDLELAFQGNLCRCTGYRPIIEGYKTFTEDWEIMQNGTALANGNGTCAMGDQCCKLQNGHTNGENDEQDVLFKTNEFAPFDPSQEPIFPPELKLYDTLDRQNLVFKGKEVIWYRPTELKDLLDLKQKYNYAKIIVGNTEVGVEVKYKHFLYPILIQPVLIQEMIEIKTMENGIKVGASASLQDMEDALKEEIKLQPEYKTRIFTAILDMLHWFAGKQIRNVAGVGGNIMTGSPISDLNQIFIASKVELELRSKERGVRIVTMDKNFFTGYRKSIVMEDEILVSIIIPYTKENQYFYAYKQARRRDDDIAIVNSALNVEFEPKSKIIRCFDLAFGGMAPTTVSAPKTCKTLIGRAWDHDTLDLAYKYLIEDLPLPPDAPGGMVQYRRALTLSFFFRAFLAISEQLSFVLPEMKLDEREKSAISGLTTQTPKSSQYFQVLPSEEKINTIGKPVPHLAAFKHASGEAVYCDDIPPLSNELYMAFVLSTKAHANILSMDPSEALKMEGVHAFFSAKDLPEEKNRLGVSKEEVVFISKTVTSQGQILGAIIAEDQATAQKATRKVKITYEELKPVIISIEDAIKHNSYFADVPNPKFVEKGDVDTVFATAPHIIEGSTRNGAQEHFYLETQCTLAVPKNEDNEMEIFCSTQFPSVISKLVAEVLNVPQNRIITKVKRIGGGFGGKENKAAYIAVPAAIAASRLGRPVRCMLDRDEDILITGGRHAFYIKYKTAFDNDGKISACEINLYNNAGYSNDLSESVMERAMQHFENAYKIPNVRVKGYICKTNLPSNMAFRGFGAPQGMLTAEFMIRKIAEYLDKDVVQLSRLNLYQEGDVTHYNQKLEYCTIGRCWDECIASSDVIKRREEIQEYNRQNRWKKRGISVVPTKYGVAFPPVFLNQAGALIHVYTDGSVLLTHGGAEMGQGLHTKMTQVASRVLEIPHSKIHISETSTDKVPNTAPTAASFSSDLNGMAVMNACEIIKQRLEPYKKANPKGTWENWVSAAYFDRVSLSTTGFFKLPYTGYDWKTNSGTAYHYFTCGVACSEVEIDCLTGDHQILRTDIVMDVGESMNPAIDIGQIEGAFMQGYGLYMLEEMMFAPDGTVLTKGPGAYKLPGFTNIPLELNVSLLKGAPNPRAIYSSKAIGEPPLFLASSVLFAVREAIKAARSDAGSSRKEFILHAPVTSAKIRMACQDHLTAKVMERAMQHFENAYKIPNVRVKGYICKTNLPSNMAFRGFGAPQGMLTAEFMIRKIAEYLDKDVVQLSRLNLYQEGDVTHYNQKLEYCTIGRCWDECIASSDVIKRREEIQEYNRQNRWKKRGISVVPTKYGVAFPPVFLNQAGALIHVYTDGSVLLTHGGAEMGQGLHTKMTQVASRVLEIPHSKVHISETSTDKVPNTAPTAASFSSDLNGMAVMNACEIIKQRLEPYKKANPKGTWENWVSAAYFDRVSLSTTGFFKLPYTGYDWKTNSGTAYHYFTCGVACSEVEIDCLTGDHQILRTDIVMDVGESMNPAIDIGQIEGAFMQGYGLYMLEEMMFAPDGTVLTKGPGAYKLPGFTNIPLELNVSLLKGAPNPRAIYSSKAIGEPPLFLASSVLFAVREAIKAARSDAGSSRKEFILHAPVTSAKIRMACQDHLTAKLEEPKPGTFTPWNIIP